MSGAGSILHVEGLTKRFEMRRPAMDVLMGRGRATMIAVNQVSLTVSPGQTLGVVGESGCGKSTLARCIVGLQQPDSGSILFEGDNVLSLTGAGRRRYHRRVQMVFQDPYGSLNPRMTIGGALVEVLAVHRLAPAAEIPARVKSLLDLVHLPESAANRYPHEFSGGQRQRIGIARALAVQPAVLIADEPVSALDVSVQAQIVNLFLELQSRLGLAIVFITHDLRLVRHIAHRTAVMYLGRIVEMGPTDQVFEAPKHPYTQALIRAVPQMRGFARRNQSREAALKGELPSPFAPPAGCAFHPRCPIAVARCRNEAPPLRSMKLDDPLCVWEAACHLADIATSNANAIRAAPDWAI